MRPSPNLLAGVLAVLSWGFLAQPAQANFTVTLDTEWNPANPNPVNYGSVSFVDGTGSNGAAVGQVLITVTNSAENGGVLKEFYLNFVSGQSALLGGLSVTVDTLHSPSGLTAGLLTGYDNQKADGTGGNYDITIDFKPEGSQLALNQSATLVVSSSAGAINASMFDYLSVDATSPTPNLTVSAHFAGDPSPFVGGNEDIEEAPVITPAPAGLVLVLSGAPFFFVGRTLRRRLLAAA